MKTKYCKSEKFQIGPNTEKIVKCFLINVFPPHQKRLLKKIIQAFFFKIKKTSYTLLRKKIKYFKYEKF